MQERHGGITGLVLCKNAYQAENEMRDEQQTLAGYGIEGVPKRAEPHVIVKIFYDFKPSVQEPLLLES